MGSLKAQQMAIKVSESVRSKKPPKTLGQLARESGYSDNFSKQPSRIRATKSFIKAMEIEQRPIIEGLQSEISRIKAALANKDYNLEETRILAGTLDILVKNFQLLSGGATERQVFVLPSEVINRNEITTSEPKTALPEATQELKDGSS